MLLLQLTSWGEGVIWAGKQTFKPCNTFSLNLAKSSQSETRRILPNPTPDTKQL